MNSRCNRSCSRACAAHSSSAASSSRARAARVHSPRSAAPRAASRTAASASWCSSCAARSASACASASEYSSAETRVSASSRSHTTADGSPGTHVHATRRSTALTRIAATAPARPSAPPRSVSRSARVSTSRTSMPAVRPQHTHTRRPIGSSAVGCPAHPTRCTHANVGAPTHLHTEPSSEAESTWPGPEASRARTLPVCSERRVATHASDCASWKIACARSHTRSVASSAPDQMCAPSTRTQRTACVWPTKLRLSTPRAVHTHSLRSLPPVTTRRPPLPPPTGAPGAVDNGRCGAMHCTPPACPLDSSRVSARVCASYRRSAPPSVPHHTVSRAAWPFVSACLGTTAIVRIR
mmetsp:Transcript_9666/g.25010  ORF Transcript_9666/g.25010 Transcript_9666/m.25010 type:complete len:353 (-) Transcript_9666:210-1268(-)